MGKQVPDAIKDLQLDQVEGTRIHFTAGEPADYAAVLLQELAAANITGSYTKSNGPVTGRQTQCPAQTGVPISADGNVDHVAVTDGASTLLVVSTTTPQGVTSGGTLDSNAWNHIIPDPT